MALISSSLANLSSASCISTRIYVNERHSQPMHVHFRPVRVSAAATATCSSTAERTLPRQHVKAPASLYEVLGVQTGATGKEIKDAYRRLARVLHPDVSANGEKENTAFEFMKLHEAYETLSDPEKRADYDQTISARRIRRRPMSYPFEVSGFANSMGVSSPASGFPGYTRRTWETDQCW